MRDDIVERCGLAVRKAKAGLQTDEAIARAVLAAFKEATAEPTPGMIEAAIIDRDDDADWAKTMKHAHYVMHVQMYEEIGI